MLHTDWNPANVLIGERTWLVDWGWATRGAPWLDAAYWITWLVAAGHQPDAAETLPLEFPAFAAAPAAAVTVFARANARMWAQLAGTSPDEWTSYLRQASETWARHRRNEE
ncbi:hypothetical protein GCM10020358_68420 [Amorphoplanes nipponensis]|uniref:Phosphotransferase enzyme family protein n=1 Tax=Actinoplanes nipponensis TaxID=135950 RepID=A0A919MP03_9ACTN|nr:hypothetical protein Ani05nite_50660 [Actinoplanes nipponensis]